MNSILLAGLALAAATDVDLSAANTSAVEAATAPTVVASAPPVAPTLIENPFTTIDPPREHSLERLSIFPTIARPAAPVLKPDRVRRDATLAQGSGVLDDFGTAGALGSRFVTNVAGLVGAVITLAILLWSVLVHRRVRRTVAPAVVRKVSLRDCDTFAIPHQPSIAAAADLDPLTGWQPPAPRPTRTVRRSAAPHNAMATGQVAWATYKFFILNAGGIIETARESAHAGDDAALNHARSFGEGVAVEVWLDRRKIATVG